MKADIRAELRSGMSLEDVQLADQHQALVLLPQDEDNILPTTKFDDTASTDDQAISETTAKGPINESVPPSQPRRLSQAQICRKRYRNFELRIRS